MPLSKPILIYLALPRPRYLVKWLFFIGAFGAAAYVSGGVTRHELSNAILLLVVLEYLVYQARYQCNDVIGLNSDQRHPERTLRRRLPQGDTDEQARYFMVVSLLVASGRLIAALSVGILTPDLLEPTIAVTVAILASTLIYELLRLRGAVRPLWIFVGTGYAIRGATGLAAGGLAGNKLAIVAGAGALTAFGIAFVTMTWTLEALSVCSSTSLPFEPLSDKPHLLALLSFLPCSIASGGHDGGPALRSNIALRAPWHLAFATAGLLGGIAGAALCGSDNVVITAVVAATGSLAVSAVVMRSRSVLAAGMATAAGALLVSIFGVANHAQRPLLLAAPTAAFAVVFVWFREQSYASLMSWPRARRPRRPVVAQPGLLGRLSD